MFFRWTVCRRPSRATWLSLWMQRRVFRLSMWAEYWRLPSILEYTVSLLSLRITLAKMVDHVLIRLVDSCANAPLDLLAIYVNLILMYAIRCHVRMVELVLIWKEIMNAVVQLILLVDNVKFRMKRPYYQITLRLRWIRRPISRILFF